MPIRELNVSEIEKAVSDLCIKSNIYLPQSLEQCIKCAALSEKSQTGKEVLNDLARNIEVAKKENLPICQDTGMAVIFIDIGQDVHLIGGDLYESINNGVAKGYKEGYLRCSIVKDPIERINTGDNTPAVIHMKIVKGDKVHISVCPKGFGSENMSQLRMFTPSVTVYEICEFVVSVVTEAGSNPCPPIVVGVGIGGNFEYSAFLSKKALCRDVAIDNPKKLYADMEKNMLLQINNTGIGPQGFGGTVTALKVNIEDAPTHIAGLPVAVNIGCHVTRHADAII